MQPIELKQIITPKDKNKSVLHLLIEGSNVVIHIDDGTKNFICALLDFSFEHIEMSDGITIFKPKKVLGKVTDTIKKNKMISKKNN